MGDATKNNRARGRAGVVLGKAPPGLAPGGPAGPPPLNAGAPEESEPSLKEVMGVLSTLARDVAELKAQAGGVPE